MEKWWWTWRNRILFIFTPVRRYRATSKAKTAAPLFRLIFLPGEVAALHRLMDRKTGTWQQHMASCFREHVVVNNYYSTTYRAFFPFRPIDESHAAARQRKSNQARRSWCYAATCLLSLARRSWCYAATCLLSLARRSTWYNVIRQTKLLFINVHNKLKGKLRKKNYRSDPKNEVPERCAFYVVTCFFNFYVQVSKVKPMMLTFESLEFHTNWFALHRIPDTFVSLTTWAPKGRGCSHATWTAWGDLHVACRMSSLDL